MRKVFAALFLCLISTKVFAGAPFCAQVFSAPQIHYEIHGEKNSQVLVLIHGLDSAAATFAPVIDQLAEKYKVIVYDQRGHGKTEAQGDIYSSEVMAQDLETLLRDLKIDKVSLLGHSMGARTAMAFAQRNPGRVKALIIEDMELFARQKFSEDSFAKVLAKAQELRRLPKHYQSREEMIHALKPIYGDEAESLTYRRARQNADGSLDLLFRPDISYLYGYRGNTDDFTQALRHLQAPLLVLKSDPRRGTALSEHGVQHIKDNAPSAQIIEIKDATHNIHGSQTQKFLELVEGFLGRVL